MAPHVLIIGGGIAALKASATLTAHNIPFTILEAKDRLGGRIYTVRGRNGKYDLGASWYHETLNNALFDEENKLSFESSVSLPHFYDDMPEKVMTRDHGTVPGSWKLDAIRREIDTFVDMKSKEDVDSGFDESYSDSVVDYLRKKKHLLTDVQIEYSYQYARSLELWHGIDILRLSSKYAAIENEGRDAFAQYYDSVVNRHVNILDPANIRLNTPVKKIQKTKQRIVLVTTATGEVLKGDYCIVTVPQSILQITDTEDPAYIEFIPQLPCRITNSLSKVHFGALGKVIFEFDYIFWPTDAERVKILAVPQSGFLDSIRHDKDLPSSHSGTTFDTWDYPILFLNYGTTTSKPTLSLLMQSPLTEYIESHPSIAFEFFKPHLELLAGKTAIPDPLNTIVTAWTRDPFQKGSYSACYPGDDPLSAILALEEGWGIVRFAGEATILEGGGCVHGAWNSGEREAQWILSRIKEVT